MVIQNYLFDNSFQIVKRADVSIAGHGNITYIPMFFLIDHGRVILCFTDDLTNWFYISKIKIATI